LLNTEHNKNLVERKLEHIGTPVEIEFFDSIAEGNYISNSFFNKYQKAGGTKSVTSECIKQFNKYCSIKNYVLKNWKVNDIRGFTLSFTKLEDTSITMTEKIEIKTVLKNSICLL
jgi:hypothetical protein